MSHLLTTRLTATALLLAMLIQMAGNLLHPGCIAARKAAITPRLQKCS